MIFEMSRPTGNINMKYRSDFQLFCRLEARGYSTEEIIEQLYGLKKGDKDFMTTKNRLSEWRRNPEYDKIWFDEMGRFGRKMLSKGLRKIKQQIDSEQDWLANKAANDVVNFAKGRVFGDEDKTVTVKIEGMPELGVPDKAEE